MNPFILIGAALFGIALAVLWYGKSKVKKPGKRFNGKKQYYTNGDLIIKWIKRDWKGGIK